MDIEALKKLAEAATPGPWHSPGLGEVHDDATNSVIVDVCWNDGEEESVGNGKQEDADYIAAANPQNVLGLISTIESLQAKVAELESALKAAYVLTDWSPDSQTVTERAAVLDRMDRYFQAKD